MPNIRFAQPIDHSLRLTVIVMMVVGSLHPAPDRAPVAEAAASIPAAYPGELLPNPTPTPTTPAVIAPESAPSAGSQNEQSVYLPLVMNASQLLAVPLPPGLAELIPAGAAVVVAEADSSGSGEHATIASSGAAVLFQQKHVMVIAEPGTYAAPVSLELKANPAPFSTLQTITTTEGLLTRPAGPDSAPLSFTLQALDAATGQPLESFDRPVRLVTDLRDVPGLEAGGDWYLAYQDSGDSRAWHRPEITIHQADGLISVQTDHFSTWAAGSEPAAWKFQPNLPAVSSFSGAATFQYPIQVPAGRAGLTPNIDVAYSSRGVDGLILSSEKDQGPLGLGWSIGGAEVSRRGVYAHCCWGGDLVMVYPDLFTLSLQGGSYDLYPEPGVDTATASVVRYYAENAPQLLVQRYYAASAPNQDKLYWIVKTPDGTAYRMGYTLDAETTQTGGQVALAGHPGAPDVTALRWQVDTVTDVFGNQIQYDYENWNKKEDSLTTEGTRPLEIRYNFAAHAPDPATRLSGSHASRIAFTGADNHRVKRIELYNVDLSRPVRTVEFGLRGVAYSGDLNCGQTSATNIITSIQEIGADGASRLPATTFEYQAQTHHGGCFRFLYLRQVDNGYGGRVRFTYTSDGRQENLHNAPRLPRYGRAYFVTTVETWDGVTPQAAVAHYSYERPCYNNTDGGFMGVLPLAFDCPQQDPVSVPGVSPHSDVGSLVGFQTATVTSIDYDGFTALSRSVTIFSQDRLTIGRPLETRVLDWDGGAWALRQETRTTYGQTAIADTAARLAFVQSTRATSYDGGEAVTVRQDFVRYDPYGNLEETIEYDADDQPYRRTLTQYEQNTANWIVGAPTRQQVFAREGAGWASLPASETRSDYNADGDPRTTAPDALGRPGASRRWSLDPATGAAQFVDTVTTFDAWGHQRTATTFGGFGTESSYASLDPRPSETIYDEASFALYPVRLTNALSHQVDIAYDLRLGLPLTITDASRVATRYRYDAFGRLTAVIRPGDTDAAPTLRYVYVDGGAPSRIETWQREVSGCAECERVTIEFYDGLGRTIQVRTEAADGQQSVANLVYDALGRTVFSYLPVFESWSGAFVRPAGWEGCARTFSQYDALGRTIRVIAPDGATMQTAFRGRQTATLDAGGHQRVSEADAFGRVVKVVEYDTGPLPAIDFDLAPYSTTRYAYDVLDQLTRVDTLTTTTVITYNALGQKTAMADPDMGTWAYVYDAAGNLQSQTDARGVTTTFQYDALNRLTAKAYTIPVGQGVVDPGAARFDYDENGAIGQRTRMTDATGTITWAYDERGRVISETRALAHNLGTYTFQYAYNAADQMTALTYPDGETITTTLNGASQPIGLTTSLGAAYAHDAGYDAQGRLTGWTLGNGLPAVQDYYLPTDLHQGGRLRRLRVGDGLLDLAYTYDATGNITRLDDLSQGLGEGQALHVRYDALDRLIRAWTTGSPLGGYEHEYRYDALGRFIDKLEDGQALGYAYDDPAHIHAATTLGPDNAYVYDPNGNMTVRVENGVAYTQTWTAENRLARVTWAEGGRAYTTTLVYDGDGGRTLKIDDDGVAEITTLYIGGLFEKQVDTTASDLGRLPGQATVAKAAPAPKGQHGLAKARLRDYTGPGNRTVPEWVPPTYGWGSAEVHASAGSCADKPAYPIPEDECGDGAIRWTLAECPSLGTAPCKSGQRYHLTGGGYTTTVTYDAATIAGEISCTYGLNGWCITPAILTMTGHESMPGRVITGISYSTHLSGSPSYTENTNPFTLTIEDAASIIYYYWAESSHGDQSGMDGLIVKVDAQPPAIQVDGPAPGAWYTTSDGITFSVSDSTSGPKCIRARWGDWPEDNNNCSGTTGLTFHPGEGEAILYLYAWDNAGNRAEWQGTFKRDVTPPINPGLATTACAANDLWQGTCASPSFTWSGASDSGSGVAGYEYYWGPSSAATSGAWTAANAYNAGSMNEGTHYLRLRTRNRAGLWSDWATLFVFRYDSTAPATAYTLSGTTGENGWYRSDVEVTLTVTDTLSGPAATQYQLAPAGAWIDYTTPILLTESGAHLLEFRSRDAAGNEEAIQTIEISIDALPPSLDAASAVETSSQNVEDDAWQNRVSRPRFSWSGVTDLPAQALAGYHAYWGTDPAGTAPYDDASSAVHEPSGGVESGSTYYLRVQARDEAGNWSGWRTLFTFRFDAIRPQIESLLPFDGAVLTDTQPIVTAAFSDTASGAGLAAPILILDQQIVAPTVAAGSLAYRPSIPLAPGLHTVTLYVADQAGNQTMARQSFRIDPDTYVRLVSPVDGTALNRLATSVIVEGEPGAAVTLITAVETFTHIFDASGRWEIPAVALTAGASTLRAEVVDATGNTASHSISVTVDSSQDAAQVRAEQDTVNPRLGPVLFSITALAGGGRQVRGWSLRVQDTGAQIQATISGSAEADQQVVLWNGRTPTGDYAPDGVYAYQLVVTTTGDLVTQSPVGSLSILSEPPAAPTLDCGPQGETWFSQPPALAHGTAAYSASVVVYQDGEPQFVAPVFDSHWQQPIALVQGAPFSTMVAVRALDAAGNLSAPSAACRMGLTQSDPFTLPHAALSQDVIGLNASVQMTATTRADGAPLAPEGVRVLLPAGLGDAPALGVVGSTSTADTWAGEWQLPETGAWEAPATLVFSAADISVPAPNQGTQFVQPYVDLVPPYVYLAWPWNGYGQSQAALGPRGMAEPFSTVTVTAARLGEGDAITATAQSDALGRWQAGLVLPDGLYRLSAQTVDRAGNLGLASDPITITIDTTAPLIADVALEPAFVRPSQALTVTAVITDAASGVAGVEAQAWDLPRLGQGVAVALQPASGQYAGALSISQDTGEGMKPVTIQARDWLDNTNVLTGAAVIVDATPPILVGLTITAADANTVITGSTAYYGPQSNGELAVAITAGDDSAGHVTAGLESVTYPAAFGDDALTLALDGVRAAATYTRTHTITGTAEGAYFVSVADRAGNVAAWRYNLIHDSSPPTVTVSAPQSAGLKFTVQWGGADDRAGVRTFTTQYREAQSPAWTDWLAGTTETQAEFRGQDGHRYVFRVQAIDQVGNVSEWQEAAVTVAAVTKYYQFAGQRLALRRGEAVYYLHGDHLGSASLVTDAAGHIVSEMRYLPYGQERLLAGDSPTDFGFTGQRKDGFGLMDYNARFYSPRLGQFVSADTIVPKPENPRAFNRYAYSLSNPLRYIDPSGHDYLCAQSCEEQADKDWRIVDPVPLTPKGEQMLELCKVYYGGTCNSQDFLARGLAPEFKTIDLRRNPDAKIIIQKLKDSTTYSLYQKCSFERGGPCASLTQNAVMNWMGGFSSTSYDMYERWKSGMSAHDAVNKNINPLAAEVARHAMSSSDPVAGVIDTCNLPASWGNMSLYQVPVEKWGGSIESALTIQGLGSPLWTYGLPGQNLFYIFSVKQIRFLQQFRK